MKQRFDFLVLTLFLLTLCCLTFTTLTAIDLGWHLKTGLWILQNKQIPHYDFYSSIANGQPWIDLHWGFQILVYTIARLGGLLGLNIFKLFVLMIVYLLLYKIAGRGKPLLTAFVFLGMLLVSQERYQIRPEILSFAFMTLYLHLLETESKYLWSLPIFQTMWTNVEGLFMIGPGLAGIYWLGQIFEKKSSKKFFLVMLSTVLACFVNPYGWKGFIFPLTLFKEISLKNSMPSLFIGEFFPPYSALAQSASNIFFFILLTIVLIFCIVRIKKLRPAHILLALAFSILGLMAQRNTALFALIVPLILLKNFEIHSFRYISQARIMGTIVFIFCCIYLSFSAFSNSLFVKDRRLERFGLGVAPEIYPLKALQYLAQKPADGTLFNTMDLGPAIIFSGWPDLKPFIDTRLEVYTPEQLHEYKSFMSGEIPLDEFIQKYNISSFLLDHIQKNSLQMIGRLNNHPHWKLSYADEICVIFRKKENDLTPLTYIQPEEIPEKSVYQILREFIPFFPEETVFPYQNIYMGRLFLGLKEWEAARQQYEKVTVVFPAWTESWINLAFLEEKNGNIPQAIEYLEKAIEYDSQSYQAQFNIGNLYLKTEQYSKAVTALRKAVALQSTPQARHNLSIAEKFDEISKIQSK